MRKEVLFVTVLSLFFAFAGLVSGASVSNDLHLNVQVLYANGSIHPGTYTFTFNISNSSDCNATNVVYNNTQIIATDSNGVVSAYLPNVTLPFNQQYWLCYYRDGTLIETDKFTRSPYAFRAEYVNLSGVGVDTNLNLSSYNATANYGFFNFLGTLINPIGSIFANKITTSGNISTSAYYLGNGKYLTGVTATQSPAGTNGSVQFNNEPQGTGGNASAFWFNNSKHEVGINGSLVVNGVNWSSSHGAIIASGNNTNGSYVQYADGTMVEWYQDPNSLVTSSTMIGSLYYNTRSYTFPLPFSSIPAIIQGNEAGAQGTWSGTSYGVNNDNFTYVLMGGNSPYAAFPNYIAIGRWTNLSLGTGSGGSGGIVNTITNSYGTCTQWANGVQECYYTSPSCYNTTSLDTNGIYFYQGAVNFPANFSSPPVIITNPVGGHGGNTWGGNAQQITNSGAMLVIESTDGSVACGNLSYTAVGRWTNATSVNTPDYSTWGLDSNGNIVTVNLSKDVNITGKLYVNGSLISNVPEGAVVAFNSATCPVGWVPANGSAGTPDLRGLFIRGAGTSGSYTMANGTAFGAVFGQEQNDLFQRFNLNVYDTASSLQAILYSPGGGNSANSNWFGTASDSGGQTYIGYVYAAGPSSAGTAYGTPRYGGETRPASYALTYCVKITGDSMQSNSIWGTNNGNVTLSNQSQDVSLPNNLNVGGSVTVSGNSPSTPEANTLYSDSLPKAWVRFNGNSCTGTSGSCTHATCAVYGSFNIACVDRTATGRYTVYFKTPLSNANYAAVCNSMLSGSAMYLCTEENFAAGSVSVDVDTTSNAAANGDQTSMTIFGA